MNFSDTIFINQEELKIAFNIMNNPNKKFYLFDGVIGAGKTTLIKRLEEYMNKTGLKVKAIYEPVDVWNETKALQYFYEDIPAHSYEFQTFTFITRIKRVLSSLIENQDCDIYLLERSIWTDRHVFFELLKPSFGTVRIEMYNQWCNLWSYLMPLKPTCWIFLDTSIDETMNRINGRNRDGESKISIQYQRDLYTKHLEFYNSLENMGHNIKKVPKQLMDSPFNTDEEAIKSVYKWIFLD